VRGVGVAKVRGTDEEADEAAGEGDAAVESVLAHGAIPLRTPRRAPPCTVGGESEGGVGGLREATAGFRMGGCMDGDGGEGRQRGKAGKRRRETEGMGGWECDVGCEERHYL
jgi:hypothetical protein